MLDPQAVRFASPPVRTVRLAYYFEMPTPVMGLHGGALRELWRRSYPVADEIAPRAPVGGEPEEFAVVEEEDRWPVPFFTFESPETQRSIFFQADRFGVTWEFDPSAEEERQYPGFQALADEMHARYEEFLSVVERDSEQAVRPTSAECLYANELADITLNSYVTGYLTGWQNTPDLKVSSEDEPATYVRHTHAEGAGNELVWVRASSADAGVSLSITSRVESGTFASPRHRLLTAHDRLISSFFDATSESMRDAWGPE